MENGRAIVVPGAGSVGVFISVVKGEAMVLMCPVDVCSAVGGRWFGKPPTRLYLVIRYHTTNGEQRSMSLFET